MGTIFKVGRLHKAFVRCDDATWREFRANLTLRNMTAQDYLGELVYRDVLKARRDKKANEAKRAKRANG